MPIHITMASTVLRKHIQRGFSTNTDNSSLRSAFSYCVDQVRNHDYENYIWCIQLPKELRPAIIALRSFNIETALIGAKTASEIMIMTRFQWWRDAINAAYKGKAPEQPTMTALAKTIDHCRLHRYRLLKMLSTREEDVLRNNPYKTLDELETYAEGTASQLLLLQLQAAGIINHENDSRTSHEEWAAASTETATSHIGKAVGLTSLIRGTLHHAEHNRTYLPLDICEKYGCHPDDVVHGTAGTALQEIIKEMAMLAQAHLHAGRDHSEQVLAAAKPLLLPSIRIEMYLDALKKKGYNVLDPGLAHGRDVSPLWYQLKLKYCLMTGSY